MKKLIFSLLILCLLSGKNLHSQEYTPMLSDTCSWYNTYMPSYTLETQAFKIFPLDTNLNGKQYKKLLGFSCMRDLYYKPVCYLREDTIEKRIYLVELNDNAYHENLLYDFNLEPGDTFKIYTFNYYLKSSLNEQLILKSIRDTSIFNRSWKIFHFNNNAKWIEGIGSLYGFFHTANSPYGFVLSCYYKDNELMYKWLEVDFFQTCCIFTGIEEKSLPGWVKNIYPSPFQDVLSIDFQVAVFNTIALSVHDITGKKVYYGEHEVIPGNGTIKLQDLGHLPSGIYLLKGRAGDKNFTVKICKGFRQGH